MKHSGRAYLVFGIAAVLMMLGSCSLFNFGGEVDATLKVASGNSSNSRGIGAKALGSSGGQIDGFRLWVKGLSVMTEEGGESFGIWSSSEEGGTEIDLRSDGDLKTITEQIRVPTGSYKRVIIQYYDHFSLKAKAELDGTLYYTTSDGITSTSDASPGSDYGFYHYNFVNLTTGNPYETDQENQQDIVTEEPFIIESGSAYEFDILVDLAHLAYFWDGSGDRVAPFTWEPNGDYPKSDFFPEGEPNFGVQYIPIAFGIGKADDSAYAPFLETYVIASEGTDIAADPHSNQYGTTTFAFLNGGSTAPYWGRTRNFDMSSFEQFYSNFDGNGDGTFSCTNDEHESTGGITVTSFPRLDVGESGTVTTDSPDSFAVYRIK
jgi:hypothetical protein